MTNHIFVDSREPPDLLDIIEQSVGQDLVEKVLLPTADIVLTDKCGCLVGIERKTPLDLLGSIADGRLTRQLSRLKAEYDTAILLVEGWFQLSHDMTVKANSRPTGWKHAAVQMALFSLAQQGVIVHYVPSLAGTGDFVRVLNLRGKETCLAGKRTPGDSSLLWLEHERGGPSAGIRQDSSLSVGAPERAAAARDRAVGERPTGITLRHPEKGRRQKRA